MDVTTTTLLVALLLSTLVGGSLGLLGGGGSILTTPILLYVVGMGSHEAIATSLLVVGGTSLVALLPHARGGRVRWRTGALFGVTSMAGAYTAGRFAHLLPGTVLILAFGGMMVVTAAAMMRKGRAPQRAEATAASAEAPRSMAKIVLDGLIVGGVTGLVGAGGGFLVVPALVILGGLPMREAVGTSLLVITLKSFAALAGHLGATPIDFGLATLITGAAIVGSLGGSSFAGRVRQDVLRRGFAWFVVVMAVFLLSQEVPRAVGTPVELATHWPWVLGGVSLPLVAGLVDLRRMSNQPTERKS